MMKLDKSFEKHPKAEIFLKQWTSTLGETEKAQKINTLT